MTSKASVSQMIEIAEQLDLNITAIAAQGLQAACSLLADAIVSEHGEESLNPGAHTDVYDKDSLILNGGLKVDVSHMLEICQSTKSMAIARAGETVEAAALFLARAIAEELKVSAIDFVADPVAYGGALASFGPAYSGAPWPELLENADPGADWML